MQVTEQMDRAIRAGIKDGYEALFKGFFKQAGLSDVDRILLMNSKEFEKAVTETCTFIKVKLDKVIYESP